MGISYRDIQLQKNRLRRSIILRNRVIWQNYIDFFNNEGVCEKCGKHGPIGDDGLCEECSNQYAYGID